MMPGPAPEVAALLADRVLARLGRGPEALDALLADALYHELERLRTERNTRATRAEKRFWRGVNRDHRRTDTAGKEALVRLIVARYAEEILGRFDKRLYGLVTRVLSYGLLAMLNRFSPASFLGTLSSRLNLRKNVIVSGPLEDIRRLARHSTLILCPTHQSNLDSVVLGLALYFSRLPPVTYAAGLNLFKNPVVAFFMKNLGAYKVDRRKKNILYKATLKQYSSLSLELGHHQLFFPGGTRNRRGDGESHLKLGLLGCGLEVYTRERKPLFVVPCTLSYGLVLEARPLIEEHLRETGKGRFVPPPREFGRFFRAYRFWRNLQSLDSRIHVHFCPPLDLFGNRVDRDGRSFDKRGRPLDPLRYLDGPAGPGPDPQRDEEYTRILGEALLDSFRKHATLMATHAAAFCFFFLLRRRRPAHDLYRFLVTAGPADRIAQADLLRVLGALLLRLRRLEAEGRLRLEEALKEAAPEAVLEGALAGFASFHDGRTLRREGAELFTLDMRLVYYYRNRLDPYALENGLDAAQDSSSPRSA